MTVSRVSIYGLSLADGYAYLFVPVAALNDSYFLPSYVHYRCQLKQDQVRDRRIGLQCFGNGCWEVPNYRQLL